MFLLSDYEQLVSKPEYLDSFQVSGMALLLGSFYMGQGAGCFSAQRRV